MSPRVAIWIAWGELRVLLWAIFPALAGRARRRELAAIAVQQAIVEAAAARAWAKRGPTGGAS